MSKKIVDKLNRNFKKKVVLKSQKWVKEHMFMIKIFAEINIERGTLHHRKTWSDLSEKTREKLTKMGIGKDEYELGQSEWEEITSDKVKLKTRFEPRTNGAIGTVYSNEEIAEIMEYGGRTTIIEQKPGGARIRRIAYLEGRPFFLYAVNKVEELAEKSLESYLQLDDIEVEIEI